ncbi:MAG: hypothetical protein ACK559_31375, partial [bacterium]
QRVKDDRVVAVGSGRLLCQVPVGVGKCEAEDAVPVGAELGGGPLQQVMVQLVVGGERVLAGEDLRAQRHLGGGEDALVDVLQDGEPFGQQAQAHELEGRAHRGVVQKGLADRPGAGRADRGRGRAGRHR